MKKRYLVLVVCFIMVSFKVILVCFRNKPLTKEQKVQDFNQLYTVIKRYYPFFDSYAGDWLDNKDTYINMVKDTKDDKEFINLIKSSLSDLHQRHTLLQNKEFYNFSKKVYNRMGLFNCYNKQRVVDRYDSKDWEKITNQEEKKKVNNNLVNPQSPNVRDIIPGELGYMHLHSMENEESGLKKDLEKIKNYIKGMDNYKAVVIDIRGNTGGSDSFWTSIVSMLANKTYSSIGYTLYRDGDMIKNYLYDREKAFHEKIDLKDINTIPESVYQNTSKETIKKFKYYIKQTRSLKPNPVSEFKGHIYLLTNKDVYSSAEEFSVFCKESKFATIIGQTTGGGGGSGVDPIKFDLKNSGLIISMQAETYISQSGINDDEFGTTPDYIIDNDKMDTTSDAYLNKCIDKVKELENINNYN